MAFYSQRADFLAPKFWIFYHFSASLNKYILKKLQIRTFLIYTKNSLSSSDVTAFIYLTKQKRTLISHRFRDLLGSIPLSKAVK